MTDYTQPGLYLINSTGEMVPVHTANGGDQEVLREYLREWDVPGVEVSDG